MSHSLGLAAARYLKRKFCHRRQSSGGYRRTGSNRRPRPSRVRWQFPDWRRRYLPDGFTRMPVLRFQSLRHADSLDVRERHLLHPFGRLRSPVWRGRNNELNRDRWRERFSRQRWQLCGYGWRQHCHGRLKLRHRRDSNRGFQQQRDNELCNEDLRTGVPRPRGFNSPLFNDAGPRRLCRRMPRIRRLRRDPGLLLPHGIKHSERVTR